MLRLKLFLVWHYLSHHSIPCLACRCIAADYEDPITTGATILAWGGVLAAIISSSHI